MFTDEEAKTKWCPFVRASIYEAADNDVSGNRAGPLRESGGCIASQCMAWRWDMEWSSAVEEGQGNDLVLRLKRRKGEPRRGYCGMAVRPE